MSGGLMSGGRMSGGRLSGGLMSAHRWAIVQWALLTGELRVTASTELINDRTVKRTAKLKKLAAGQKSMQDTRKLSTKYST